MLKWPISTVQTRDNNLHIINHTVYSNYNHNVDKQIYIKLLLRTHAYFLFCTVDAILLTSKTTKHLCHDCIRVYAKLSIKLILVICEKKIKNFTVTTCKKCTKFFYFFLRQLKRSF